MNIPNALTENRVTQLIRAELKRWHRKNPSTGGDGTPDLTNPTFIYTAGLLSRINYDNSIHKEFTYNVDDQLTQLQEFANGLITKTKTFLYNPDDTLASITES